MSGKAIVEFALNAKTTEDVDVLIEMLKPFADNSSFKSVELLYS